MYVGVNVELDRLVVVLFEPGDISVDHLRELASFAEMVPPGHSICMRVDVANCPTNLDISPDCIPRIHPGYKELNAWSK